jgi:hypothetical protein
LDRQTRAAVVGQIQKNSFGNVRKRDPFVVYRPLISTG